MIMISAEFPGSFTKKVFTEALVTALRALSMFYASKGAKIEIVMDGSELGALAQVQKE